MQKEHYDGVNHLMKEGTMNYRVTVNGVTIARFQLMEDAKFFVDASLERLMFGIDPRVQIIARNGETFVPAEWQTVGA